MTYQKSATLSRSLELHLFLGPFSFRLTCYLVSRKRITPPNNYLAVTVSTKQEQWPISGIPFYCHIGPKQYYPHTENRPRVQFLGNQRNEAMSRALALYPKTTHIINIESYYLPQREPIQQLIDEYERLNDNVILGAATWAKLQNRILTYFQFYDGWATPELYYLRYYHTPPKGLAQVSSVGSCFIFPAEAWRRHRFVTPEPFPKAGIYYNWLCQESGLPVLLDLDIRFYRDCNNSHLPYYSPWKRIKATLWKPVRQHLPPALTPAWRGIFTSLPGATGHLSWGRNLRSAFSNRRTQSQ